MSDMVRTERLELRLMDVQDAEAVFAYRSDRDTNRYQGWLPERLEDVYTWMDKRAPAFGEPGWSQLVLVDRQSGRIIGDIGVRIDAEGQFGIGYTLARTEHGRGLATEAVAALLDYMFQNMEQQRCTADVLKENTASIKLLVRLGFSPEADTSQVAEGCELRYFMQADQWRALAHSR